MTDVLFWLANYLAYGIFVVWAFNAIGNRRNRGYTLWDQIRDDERYEDVLSSSVIWLFIQGIFLVLWPACYVYIVFKERTPS